MTICVAVKVHDCLVFAADSALSLTNGNMTANVYDHGNKVFNLVKGLPVCAMFCGMGNIGRASISSLAKDLRRMLSKKPEDGGLRRDSYTIGEIAAQTKEFIFDQAYLNLPNRPEGDHGLEFYIGGYGAGSDSAEIWRFVILNGECRGPEQQFEGEDSFVLWAGQPEALNRLILGYSNRVLGALLAAGIVPEERLEEAALAIRRSTITPLAESPMPTGDAIELADFLVDTTKRYVHFLRGANTVGGETDIATVTRHEGFKWIRRKHHYPRELNLETDHA